MKHLASILAFLGCLSGATGAFGELVQVTIEQKNATPGMVLRHNVRYVVNGDVEIDASGLPATSAIRVPVGVSAVIEIPEGHSLKVIGGPGFGRLPGGCGIEVPLGSKLVLMGGGILTAVGGAAAAGGTGYGGMGGMSGVFALPKDVPPDLLPDGKTPAPPVKYEMHGGVCLTNFLSKPLVYCFTGGGGTGGDGGGGASPAIGGRGGAGGTGGAGAVGRFFIHEDKYKERPNDYANCAKYFGIAAPYVYTDNSPLAANGGAGVPGADGVMGSSCGEIVFVGNVQTNLVAGGSATGGRNGPYGSTFSGYDDQINQGDLVTALNVASCVTGFIGTGMGLVKDLASASAIFGVGSGIISIVSMFLDSAGVFEKAKMKTMVWFIGGGGGGGGASGGGAAKAIGAGGAGGGGGGGGGAGFFERGVGSVYSTSGLGKPDVTEPPLQLSGHGGQGGAAPAGGKGGWSASSDAGGQVRMVDHKDQKSVPYNANGGWIGAWTWKDSDVWGWSGHGASGGKAGSVNTNEAHIVAVKDGKYAHTITFDSGYDSPEAVDYICGTLIESAPATAAWRLIASVTNYFTGYFTSSGAKYFDRRLKPVGYPQLTGDLSLSARWTTDKPKGGITNVRHVSSGGSTLACAGDTIFVFDADCSFDNRSGTGAALSIPENATVVLSIPLLKTVSFRGGDGNGTTPGYPGIEVPTTSTLIVIGEGKLIATGGAGGDGTAGGNGSASSTGSADDASSQGGSGGIGGGGAGAGIGGRGGWANPTAAGCAAKGLSWGDSSGIWGVSGNQGDGGAKGGDGNGSGAVYLLGTVTVTANGGPCGKSGAQGSPSDKVFTAGSSYRLFAGASGGGGGGGGGGSASGIGGGAGAGGCGGAGGGSALLWRGIGSGTDHYASGGAGGGGKSSDAAACGLPAEAGKGASHTDYRDVSHSGGNGGAGGAAGAAGGTGPLFCDVKALQVNPDIPRTYDKILEMAYGHEALERTMTFKLRNLDGTEQEIATVIAQIGLALPTLPTNCTHGVKGYVMEGAYLVENGATNWWYGTDGETKLERFEGYGDVTLYVSFVPDYAHMADVPLSLSCVYANTNYVAFAANANPGCRYVSGVTNAVNAGSYSYDVRLADGYTIWRDFSTDDERTVNWEVRKAPITNEWVSCNIAYDWLMSPAENEAWLQENGLGFDLPDGATVSFARGERVQVNVEELIASIDGGSNHLDRTMYGSYSYLQPLQLKLRSYYPWETKIGIDYIKSSIVSSNVKDRKKFKGIYDYSNVVASVQARDSQGRVRFVPIDKALTVREVDTSGTGEKYSLIDLMEVKATLAKEGLSLESERNRALPIFVSIAGQTFQGGTASVDLTPEIVDGYPHYDVSDVRDIYEIAASYYFVDDSYDVAYFPTNPDYVYPILAIGTPERPGEWFRPYTATEKIVDASVTWMPTAAGTYLLEHFVTNVLFGVTGHRKAYFNFRGGSGTERPDEDVVEVKRRESGATVRYRSLADAMAGHLYGDEIRILGDVQMENERIPSGSKVVVGPDGVFRNPVASDYRHDYNTADVVTDGNGKVTEAVYRLDDEKVRATLAEGEAFGLSADGKSFGFTIGNVKPDLYYIVRRSDNIRTWSVVRKVFADGRTGTMSVSAPAAGDKGFYGVAVTDDPAPMFVTREAENGSVMIAGCDSLDAGDFAGRLVIPGEVEGKPVKGVDSWAFSDRTDIRSVDVSTVVTELGNSAFMECRNLTEVALGEGLLEIGAGAFDGTAITELVIPASVMSIGDNDLRGLKTLRFLGTPPEIGSGLKLSSDCIVYVPQDESWEGFAPSANWNGAQLEYWVDFQTSNTVEGTVAILGCGQVPPGGRLRIPAEIDGRPVTAIADAAFMGHSEITSLVLPEGLAEIGYSAFSGCAIAGQVEIPASVTFIGADAFKGCGITDLFFYGDKPETFGLIGLDPANCTVYALPDSATWGETWQNCEVCIACRYWDPVAGTETTTWAYTRVSPDTTTLGGGKLFVVRGDVTVENLCVEGTAYLVLDDGATLTANGNGQPGIRLNGGNELVIYGQSGGTGTLKANGAADCAGIGNDSGVYAGTSGSLTINGGCVKATGNGWGAGIGGSNLSARQWKWGNSGSVTVNGGRVTAIGGNGTFGGAGIGGAVYGLGGSVTVNGGTVVATGVNGGDDIGAGRFGDGNGALTITGGSVKRVHGSGATPKNSGNATVYCVTVDGLQEGPVTVTGLEGYGTHDIFADADGKVYFYLPNGSYSFTANGKSYSATVAGGTTTATPE